MNTTTSLLPEEINPESGKSVDPCDPFFDTRKPQLPKVHYLNAFTQQIIELLPSYWQEKIISKKEKKLHSAITRQMDVYQAEILKTITEKMKYGYKAEALHHSLEYLAEQQKQLKPDSEGSQNGKNTQGSIIDDVARDFLHEFQTYHFMLHWEDIKLVECRYQLQILQDRMQALSNMQTKKNYVKHQLNFLRTMPKPMSDPLKADIEQRIQYDNEKLKELLQ